MGMFLCCLILCFCIFSLFHSIRTCNRPSTCVSTVAPMVMPLNSNKVSTRDSKYPLVEFAGCSFSDTIISANSEYCMSGSLVFWLFWYLLFFWQNIQCSSSTLAVLTASLDYLFASCSAGSTEASFLVIESRSFFMVKMLRHFRWYWTGGISPSPRPSSRSKIGACCRICAAFSKVCHDSRFWGDTRLESSLESSLEQWMMHIIRACFIGTLLVFFHHSFRTSKSST